MQNKEIQMGENKKKFNVSVVLFFCIIAIFIGKGVRYTVMRETLVNTGIGWHMVNNVNNNSNKFGLTIKEQSSEESYSSATSNAGFIFQILNFFHFATNYYQYEILITIVWNILILLIISKFKRSFSLFDMFFIVVSVAVLNIFDFTLAKEPVQMLYFLLMYLILVSKKSDTFKFLGCLGIYLLCFATFRNYYILMVGFMIYIYYTFKYLMSNIKRIKFKHILILIISIFLCYYLLMNIVKVIDVASYNELFRVRLRSSSATSDMRTIFNSDNLIIFTFDYIIMMIRMLVPIELIRLGSKYALYALYQIMISVILIENLKKINKLQGSRKIAVYIYIAFLMGSAAFEPDFGSWVRHEAVLFPIVMIMNGYNEKGDEN